MIISFAMTTYIAFTTLLLALYSKTKSHELRVINSFALVLTLCATALFCSIAGLRGLDAGHDTEKYIYYYSILDKASITNFISLLIANGTGTRPEYGFWLYALLLNKLGFGPQSFLYITSITSTILFLFFFMKLSVGKSVAIVSFFIFLSSATYFILTGNYIRQAIAIPIFLIAYLEVRNEKPLLGGGYYIIATLFHYPSAVLFFVGLVLSKLSYKWLCMLFVLCCSLSATGLIINLISSKAFSLVDSNYFLHPSFLFFLIFEIVLFIDRVRVLRFGKTFHYIHKLAIVFFSLAAIFYFNANAFNRVAVIYFVLFPFLVTYYCTSAKNRHGLRFCILLILASAYMFITFSSESLLSVLGYKGMFD